MIDLHTHSTASDGSYSPEELILEAVKKGLYALALTDHDTVSGLFDFESSAQKYNFENFVPGVEISVRFKENSIHICGLFINKDSKNLSSLLSWIRNKRGKRNLRMIEKFKKLGYQISLEELNQIAVGESQGRPHMAKILVSKGYFKNTQDVFDKLLKKGEAVYVERELPSPETAISAIIEAGGIAIWAHPFSQRNLDRKNFRNNLSYLKGIGLAGLEAYYSTYTRDIQDYLLKTAKEEKMLISGGSDFHGHFVENVNLGTGMGGLSVPDGVFNDLKSVYLSKMMAKNL